jgi:pre-mRNA-processing factor SLU7
MTHTVKSCVERPRKLGANHTKSNIAPDEHLPNLEEEINYDGKRDRWRGYNPAEYQRVVDRYAKIEEEKLKVREKQLKEETFETEGEAGAAAANDSDSSDSEGDDQDEAKYADSANMIQKFDAKNRVSVRNLRIREDTAK